MAIRVSVAALWRDTFCTAFVFAHFTEARSTCSLCSPRGSSSVTPCYLRPHALLHHCGGGFSSTKNLSGRSAAIVRAAGVLFLPQRRCCLQSWLQGRFRLGEELAVVGGSEQSKGLASRHLVLLAAPRSDPPLWRRLHIWRTLSSAASMHCLQLSFLS